MPAIPEFGLVRPQTPSELAGRPPPDHHDLYLIRLIHHQTGRAFPEDRLWTAAQITHPATLRLLRVRSREGCDVYIQPHRPGEFQRKVGSQLAASRRRSGRHRLACVFR